MSIRLRRSGLVAGAIGGGVALVAIGAGLALAQPSEESLTVIPTAGEPGTTIAVSGANCDGTMAQVQLLAGDTQLDFAEAVVVPVVGTWAATLSVPSNDDLRGQSLGITALCVGGTTTYTPATFTVNTTSTTTPPSTDPPPTDPPPTNPPPTNPPPTNPPPTNPPGQPGTTAPGGTGGTTPTSAGGGQTTTTTAPGTTPTPPAVDTPAAPAMPADANHSG